MGRHGYLAKPEHLKALGGKAGKRPPPPPSRPTPEAITRAVSLEALGDALLHSARVAFTKDPNSDNRKAWQAELKAALTCFDAAGKIRYRAFAAPPVVTPQAAPDSYETLLASRETAGQR